MSYNRTKEFIELVNKAKTIPGQESELAETVKSNVLRKRFGNSEKDAQRTTDIDVNTDIKAKNKHFTEKSGAQKEKEDAESTFEAQNQEIQHKIEQGIIENAYLLNDQLTLIRNFLRSCRASYLHLNSSNLGNTGYKGQNLLRIPKRLKNHPSAKELAEMSIELSKKKKLSEAERDQIDNYVKQSVRELFKQIQQLEKLNETLVENLKESEPKNPAESTKQLFIRALKLFDPRNANSSADTATSINSVATLGTSGLKPLKKWQIVQIHYNGMTWWLNKKLMTISKFHISMEEQRIASLSSGSSFSLKFKTSLELNRTGSMNQELFRNSNSDIIKSLPESEQQQLIEENKRLLSEFEQTTDEVIKTQKALLEISTLQSQMSQHLAKQLHQTEQLYNESLGTLSNLEKGNLSLRSAQKNFASARRWVLFIILTLSFVLLFLDWFN